MLVGCDCIILVQFVRLQKINPSRHDEYDFLAQFPFQYKVRERSMSLLLHLNPDIFSQVAHSRIIGVFHEFIKRPTIPKMKSKQYAFAILCKIINTLGAVQYN